MKKNKFNNSRKPTQSRRSPSKAPRRALVRNIVAPPAPASSFENSVDLGISGLAQGLNVQSALTSLNPMFENNIYYPVTLNWTLLTYLYKSHGIVQAMIDMPVLDALRGGIDIESSELDGEDIKLMMDWMERNEAWERLTSATVWTRLYGGGGLLVNTDQNPAKPFEEKPIKKLSFYDINRWEITAPNRLDPVDQSYFQQHFLMGDTSVYDYCGQKIHFTRVLDMVGKKAPYPINLQLQGWGMSEIEKIIQNFNKYLKTDNVLYDLLEEAKIDVYRFKGLREQLSSAAGNTKTQQRVQAMNQLKNYQNAVVLDADDEYEQKQLTFSGLAEVMKENRIGIAGDLRIPITKLFGQSASGFNSGEDDIENYNAMIESEIRNKMRPTIRKMLEIVCLHLFGETFDINFKFKPLRVLSAKEEEEVKTSKYNRYKSLYDSALIDSQEMGELCEKDGLVPIQTAMATGKLDEHPEIPGQMEGEENEPSKD